VTPIRKDKVEGKGGRESKRRPLRKRTIRKKRENKDLCMIDILPLLSRLKLSTEL
jgi:hypothetical protein